MAEAAARPTADSASFPAEDRAAMSSQVAAVRACARDWRHKSLAERVSLVRRLAATLNVEAESLAQSIAAEVGKPIRFCRSELQHCLDMLDAIGRRAKYGDEIIATNPAWFARRRPHHALEQPALYPPRQDRSGSGVRQWRGLETST